MMMNMIERMKLVAGAGGLKHLPPTSTPLNLSVTMMMMTTVMMVMVMVKKAMLTLMIY